MEGSESKEIIGEITYFKEKLGESMTQNEDEFFFGIP